MSDNQGPFNVYVVGLVICAVCVYLLTDNSILGWMVVGMGLMTISTIAIVLSYLYDDKSKDKEE